MDYKYEDFTNNDMENVLEYWQDVSQDPEFISKETDLDLNTVIQILDTLQKRGDISGFNKIERRRNLDESKVLLFEELVDPEVIKSLKLDKFTDKEEYKKYFFDEREINEVYDAHIFEIKVIKVVYQQGLIVIPLEIEYKGSDYSMFMVYDSDDNVHYGSKTGEDGVEKITKTLGEENMELFDSVTEQILNDHIPNDFWEIRNKLN
jgi:hypothetical protein